MLYNILFLEYLITLLAGLLICLLRVLINVREKRLDQEERNLKNLLKEIIVGKRAWNENEWSHKKHSPLLLLRALESLDAIIDSTNWRRTKGLICDNFLLPWARSHAESLFWSRRSQSARIFLLEPRECDFPILKSLLDDSSFFIRMQAVAAIAKVPSLDNIILLLEKMATERAPARFPYRHALLNMPLESLFEIIEIYRTSTEESVRIACLDIMSQRYIGKMLKAIKVDYQHANPLIRMYVVKILGNLASEEAAEDLMQFLNDPSPQVRSIALTSLGMLKSEKTFDKVVKMLHDENYHVRLQAALALIKFGKKGIKVLETQDWDLDPKAYEIARYVLTMP